jgi:hypothetical protein
LKKHTKVYLDFFCRGDFGREYAIVLCEVCGRVASDTHHIQDRGMGGSKNKDYIENLIALCRECHNKAHRIGGVIEKEELTRIHLMKIKEIKGDKVVNKVINKPKTKLTKKEQEEERIDELVEDRLWNIRCEKDF